MINAAARDWADGQAPDLTRVRRSWRHLEAQAVDPDEDLVYCPPPALIAFAAARHRVVEGVMATHSHAHAVVDALEVAGLAVETPIAMTFDELTVGEGLDDGPVAVPAATADVISLAVVVRPAHRAHPPAPVAPSPVHGELVEPLGFSARDTHPCRRLVIGSADRLVIRLVGSGAGYYLTHSRPPPPGRPCRDPPPWSWRLRVGSSLLDEAARPPRHLADRRPSCRCTGAGATLLALPALVAVRNSDLFEELSAAP